MVCSLLNMSILCRSRILLSSVCRISSLRDKSAISRGVSSLAKAQRHRLNVYSSLCHQHWHQGGFLLCRFESKSCYTDRDQSGLTERTEKLDEETDEELKSDGGSVKTRSRGFSEVFSLDVLVSLLRQENAVDLCVIKVPNHVQYAEYFIVVSGVSPRHLRAMALYAIKVYKFLRKDGEPHVRIEGRDAEDWMCVDFGNVVVHFMLPETREVYELEKLWTLRAYDEQLKKIPAESLPEDFVLDAELTK